MSTESPHLFSDALPRFLDCASVANRSRSEIELVIEAARKIDNLQLEGRLWDLTHTLTQEHVVISRRDEISGCRGTNIITWSGFRGPHMGAKP